MSGQDNPFGALDKLLFAPTQTKSKEEKQVSDESKDKPKQVSPTPSEKKRPILTTQSSTAKLQSRKAAKVQNRKTAKVRNSEIAESQIRKGAKSHNRKTAKVQEPVRKSINHGLNIFEDQLISLKEIQLERQKALGKKYNLGDLAKEALDMFITKERSKG